MAKSTAAPPHMPFLLAWMLGRIADGPVLLQCKQQTFVLKGRRFRRSLECKLQPGAILGDHDEWFPVWNARHISMGRW